MNTSPRTTKEALFAEMLGDLDSMLTRIEKLPALIENCEARLSARANALEASGEKYGQAVAAFTEQAKGELGDFLERESISVIEKQECLLRENGNKVALSDSFFHAHSRQSHPRRLIEYLVVAIFASGLTIFLLSLIKGI